MSFSAIRASGASEKVPHTEFWFLKTNAENDRFKDLRERVLQNSGPMKFMAFANAMKSLCDKGTELEDALNKALTFAKNPSGNKRRLDKPKDENAWMLQILEAIYRAIKLDPLFNDSEFWDRDLSQDGLQTMITLAIKSSDDTSATDEKTIDDIDDIEEARTNAIKVMTNPPDEGAARALWNKAIVCVVDMKSSNPLHRWLTDPHNVALACELSSASEINDAVLEAPLPVIRTKLNQVYASRFKDRLRRLFCDSCNDKQKDPSFYIGHLAFRHKGNTTNALGTAYVPDDQNEAGSGDLVLVYYSGSGKGKTVDIAASSVTRKAALTMVLKIDDDISDGMEEAKNQAPDATDTVEQRATAIRERSSYNVLQEAMVETATRSKAAIDKVVGFIEKMNEYHRAKNPGVEVTEAKKKVIRVVVAIDEASFLKNISRSIIRQHTDFGERLGKFFMNRCTGDDARQDSNDLFRVHVVFSIAGTGVYGIAVGSQHGNYLPVKTIADHPDHRKNVYNVLRNEYSCHEKKDVKARSLPDFAEFNDFPFLRAIVHNNSRMTSILLNEMNATQFSPRHPHEEARLLIRIFDTFIESNGMRMLRNSPSEMMLTGARAIAVFLYQTEFHPEKLKEEVAASKFADMDYGLEFEEVMTDPKFTEDEGTDERKKLSKKTMMWLLVAKFGLVTPTIDKEVTKAGHNAVLTHAIPKPFEVDEAMLLLSLYMVSGREAAMSIEAFTGTTPFAFEMMSTQLINCVIAAAMTVKLEERLDLNLQHILKTHLKMYANSLGKTTEDYPEGTPLLVNERIQEVWKKLANFVPISYSTPQALQGSYYHKGNFNLKVEDPATKETGVIIKKLKLTPKDEVDSQLQPTTRENGRDLLRLTQKTAFLKIDNDLSNNMRKVLREVEKDRERVKAAKTFELPGPDNRIAKQFFPPITTLPTRTSNLADGYVSCVGVQITQEEQDGKQILRVKDLDMFTICNQSKDYFRAVSCTKLELNMNNVHNEILDEELGQHRFYCVSSRSTSFPKAPRHKKARIPFGSFPVDKVPLLRGPIKRLESLRSGGAMTHKHGKTCVKVLSGEPNAAVDVAEQLNQSSGDGEGADGENTDGESTDDDATMVGESTDDDESMDDDSDLPDLGETS